MNRRKQIIIENVSMMQDIPVENRLDKPKDQKEIAAMKQMFTELTKSKLFVLEA